MVHDRILIMVHDRILITVYDNPYITDTANNQGFQVIVQKEIPFNSKEV